MYTMNNGCHERKLECRLHNGRNGKKAKQKAERNGYYYTGRNAASWNDGSTIGIHKQGELHDNMIYIVSNYRNVMANNQQSESTFPPQHNRLSPPSLQWLFTIHNIHLSPFPAPPLCTPSLSSSQPYRPIYLIHQTRQWQLKIVTVFSLPSSLLPTSVCCAHTLIHYTYTEIPTSDDSFTHFHNNTNRSN